MGYIVDEVVVVVLWDKEDVEKCRKYVETLPENWQKLFAFIPSIVNGNTTVVMGADGSKEGWANSKIGNAYRTGFMTLLKSCGGRGVHVSMPEDGAASITETASRYDSDREWLSPSNDPESEFGLEFHEGT